MTGVDGMHGTGKAPIRRHFTVGHLLVSNPIKVCIISISISITISINPLSVSRFNFAKWINPGFFIQIEAKLGSPLKLNQSINKEGQEKNPSKKLP